MPDQPSQSFGTIAVLAPRFARSLALSGDSEAGGEVGEGLAEPLMAGVVVGADAPTPTVTVTRSGPACTAIEGFTRAASGHVPGPGAFDLRMLLDRGTIELSAAAAPAS